jgi:prevent-host-death family protein
LIQKYSIAEARRNLVAVVRELDKKDAIEITRRGEPVAVLLSMGAYRRLTAPTANFWDAYQAFRQAVPLSKLDIQPEVFEGVRDRSAGGEADWRA